MRVLSWRKCGAQPAGRRESVPPPVCCCHCCWRGAAPVNSASRSDGSVTRRWSCPQSNWPARTVAGPRTCSVAPGAVLAGVIVSSLGRIEPVAEGAESSLGPLHRGQGIGERILRRGQPAAQAGQLPHRLPRCRARQPQSRRGQAGSARRCAGCTAGHQARPGGHTSWAFEAGASGAYRRCIVPVRSGSGQRAGLSPFQGRACRGETR